MIHAKRVVLILLNDFIVRSGSYVQHAIVVFIGEEDAGIAQVVADGVLVAQYQGATTCAYVGVVHATFCMENGFQAGTIVFNAAQVVLDVEGGAALFDCFAQFVAAAVVFYFDGIAAEGEQAR